MSDVQVINDKTLIDFEGIENITKFKYRKTPPKYPKPGTFYWVEEMLYDERDGQTKPKWGLWYTTNDCELRRLDSKVYEIVIRDRDDNYIRLTDKDIFDCQELYLIIGRFIDEETGEYTKEVHTVNKDGYDYKVFKVTLNESEGHNMGLATVEGVVEYVSDSNNMFYMSNAEKFWWIGKRLGDIREGDTEQSLKDNTVSDILDKIIYPTLQPDIIQPSVKLSISENDYNVIAITDNAETGSIVIDGKTDDFILYLIETMKDHDKLLDTGWLSYHRGHLTYPTVRGSLTYPTENLDVDDDDYELYAYAGNYDENNISCNVPEKNIMSIDKIYDFSVSVWFDKGPEPLDNKGNRAKYNYDNVLDKCDCDSEEGCEKCLIPQFMGGYVTSNTQSFSLVYPIYTNNEHLKIWSKHIVDYNQPDGGDLYLEFVEEMDGHSSTSPYKMSFELPNHLKPMVYQFNEFTGEYDVEVDVHCEYTVVKHGTIYNRYMRSVSYDEKTWYDTQTKPVKYKITIKR